MPSAQTRPCTEREEGCDFGVLRGRGGSPEKPERGQASGSTPALPLGTWGLQIRGAGSTAQPGEWRSGAQASPFPPPPGLSFPRALAERSLLWDPSRPSQTQAHHKRSSFQTTREPHRGFFSALTCFPVSNASMLEHASQAWAMKSRPRRRPASFPTEELQGETVTQGNRSESGRKELLGTKATLAARS